MKKIIKFPTDEQDEFIYVEVEDMPRLGETGDGLVAVGAEEEDEGVKKATSKFEKALGPIKSIADSVINKIRQISDSPSEIVVEVGLKFNAEAGIVISKASTEANLKITMSWKKNE